MLIGYMRTKTATLRLNVQDIEEMKVMDLMFFQDGMFQQDGNRLMKIMAVLYQFTKGIVAGSAVLAGKRKGKKTK